MISEQHQAWGSWDITLKPDTPTDLLDAIDHLGHIIITPRRLDERSLWLPDWAFAVDDNEPPHPTTAYAVDDNDATFLDWAWAQDVPPPTVMYTGVVHKLPSRPRMELGGAGVAWWLDAKLVEVDVFAVESVFAAHGIGSTMRRLLLNVPVPEETR